MITEAEARELYREMLARVGDVLARDIEVGVFRGAVRGGANVRRGDLFDDEVNSEFSDLVPSSNCLRFSAYFTTHLKARMWRSVRSSGISIGWR